MYADQAAAENGSAFFGNGLAPQSKPSGRKKGPSTLRLLLIAIAGLLFLLVVLWSVLMRNKPGLDPNYGIHVGSMRGKMKGMPKIKRVMQRRGLMSTKPGPNIQGEQAKAQTVTKEMDLEHMEHAGFDPEVAAYEDGVEPEDLGYDEDEEWASELVGHEGDADHSHVVHGDGSHEDLHERDDHAHGHGVHHTGSGKHVGDDSHLHAGEQPLHIQPDHPHHEHDSVLHDHSGGHSHGHARGGWREDTEEDKHEREHKIKVRARLAEIFPLIDTNRDMHIDQGEMLVWHEENGKNMSQRRARREFNWADTNKDGQVTLAEYLADLLPEDFQGNETLAQVEASPVWKNPAHDYIARDKATFLLADADKSGGLSFEEHFAFTHPEESDDPALHRYLRLQDILDRDHNHDGKLDFHEFQEQVWSLVLEWERPSEALPEDGGAEAKARFAKLDINSNGFLDEAELIPIFHIFHPREADYARMQALHQIEVADNSGDGKLTMSEMLSNPLAFYSSSIIGDEEEEEEIHDEF